MPRTSCLFAADLHGDPARYGRLFTRATAEQPAAVLLGGDLLPGNAGMGAAPGLGPDFLEDFLAPRLQELRGSAPVPPRVILILGNDDLRSSEAAILDLEARGLLEYAHGRRLRLADFDLYGYACVPPTPFLLKDWERYDVSRYVDPGCVSPEEGRLSVPRPSREAKWGTIAADLEELAPATRSLENAVFLFHAPPHDTHLDRAALDGRTVDHAPLDPHVGSIAIRRFIERRQPLLTLHGHIHESARLTGSWRDQIGRTIALSAAHDGPELALVRFELADPAGATRELI
ncbi:MAG: metallophosphoesterase family protein [Acidobacteriota bacterium]